MKLGGGGTASSMRRTRTYMRMTSLRWLTSICPRRSTRRWMSLRVTRRCVR